MLSKAEAGYRALDHRSPCAMCRHFDRLADARQPMVEHIDHAVGDAALLVLVAWGIFIPQPSPEREIAGGQDAGDRRLAGWGEARVVIKETE